MASKEVMKLILSLIILAAAVKGVAIYSKGLVPSGVPGLSPESLNSVENVSNLLALGLAGIALLLLPVYFSKKSEENKTAKLQKK